MAQHTWKLRPRESTFLYWQLNLLFGVNKFKPICLLLKLPWFALNYTSLIPWLSSNTERYLKTPWKQGCGNLQIKDGLSWRAFTVCLRNFLVRSIAEPFLSLSNIRPPTKNFPWKQCWESLSVLWKLDFWSWKSQNIKEQVD